MGHHDPATTRVTRAARLPRRRSRALRNVKPAAVLTGMLVSLPLVVLAWVILQGSPWVWASAVLGEHVLGGGLAGGMARRSPGLNGALSAAMCPVLLVAGFAATYVVYNGILYGPANIVPDYLDSLPEIREFVTDEEFFGAFVFALMVAAYTSVAILVGLVSGGVVGRLFSGRLRGAGGLRAGS